MSDIKPVIATPILNFDSYEDLAHSSLPDNTLVYSDGEGIKYQKPQASGLFFGSRLHHEESLNHEKSRTDFNKAVTEKFPEISNYTVFLTPKSDLGYQNEPLTLGQIRKVIHAVHSEAHQVRNPQDPQLAKLMGSLILANEEAARTEAHLDELGYPREHLNAVFSTTGKLLLDAGLTAGALGVAGYTVVTTLVASAGAGWSTSVIIGGSLSRSSDPGETPISRVLTAGLTIGLAGGALAALGAHAAASGALDSGVAGAAALIGLNPEIGKRVGQLIAKIIPDVGASFEKTTETVSGLTEAQKALCNAVATRVIANECQKAVLEYTKTKTGALTNGNSPEALKAIFTPAEVISPSEEEITRADLETLSKAAQKGFDQIQQIQSAGRELPQELTVLLGYAEKMKDDAITLLRTSPLSQEKLEEFVHLSNESLSAIKALPGRSKSNTNVHRFQVNAQEALGLAQKLITRLSPLKTESSSKELALTYEDFFKAVRAGLTTGIEKEAKLQVREKDENDLLRLNKASEVASTVLGTGFRILDSTMKKTNEIVSATADAGGPPGLSF